MIFIKVFTASSDEGFVSKSLAGWKVYTSTGKWRSTVDKNGVIWRCFPKKMFESRDCPTKKCFEMPSHAFDKIDFHHLIM